MKAKKDKKKTVKTATGYKRYLKIILKTILWFVLSIIGFFILYGFIAFVSSRITVEGKSEEEKKVVVYLMQSGVHTDFLVPVKNELIDWAEVFPRKNTKLNDSNTRFLAIGWGDKNFYMNTPQWSDLTIKTAVYCMTGLGTAAIHATYYYDVPTDKPIIKLYLSEKQYKGLINYIKNTLVRSESGEGFFIKPENRKVVTDNDAYYEANMRYNVFHTCNTWVNNGLKACNKRACLWTPTSSGIFYQYGK